MNGMCRCSQPSRRGRAPSARCLQRIAAMNGALALVAVASTLSGCNQAGASADAEPPRPIAWAEVVPAAAEPGYWFPAVVRSIQHAPLGFEVGGRIDALLVEVGDRFAAGQVLARLDDQSHRLELEARHAEVEETKALLLEAEQHFARQQDLHGHAAASQADLDGAAAKLESTRSRLAKSRARLQLAEKDLADTVLRAPYAGVVAARTAEPAQQVRAGETLLAIQGRDRGFEVHTLLPETLIGRVTANGVARIRFPACPDHEVEGAITEIGAEAKDGGGFSVAVVLTERPCPLRAGMTAEIAVPMRAGEPATNGNAPRAPVSVAIPLSAFLSEEGTGHSAFVFRPEAQDDALGVLEKRDIVVGALSADRAIVLDGLLPGEIVASRGLPFLHERQRVRRLAVASPTGRAP